MISMLLATVEKSIGDFFESLTASLGFVGYLGLVVGIELLFILIYGIKSAFSYESRFKKAMNKANKWLFKNKKLTNENVKAFTNVLKKGPKRITYFWQQFIMYREGGPAAYMSEENLIEKPIKTSGWVSSVKNLSISTGIWAVFSFLLGVASQVSGAEPWGFKNFLLTIIFPAIVVLLGGVAIIAIKSLRGYNLEDVYQGYHIFSRFLTNACDELPPYIELDLLFTRKELSKASAQLREFYEANARKAKEAFEEAKRMEEKAADYNFKDVGIDGALLLDRAMKESENFINQKTKTLSQIAQVEAQKDAMRRNYENIQMDLQRKIQASKENIQKLIEQQSATTSRIEVGLLRQQQDKEAKKLEELQRDYDKEETRYKADRDEHEKEIARLNVIIEESRERTERGMSAEYQSFFEKVMKSAYAVAEKKVEKEKKEIAKQKDINEQELISVQTQIKRLLDENVTLRAKLSEFNPNFKDQTTHNGQYDENGNFVYLDGSYHDENGLFHDVDGNVYDMNGVNVSKDYSEEEKEENAREELVKEQITQFGTYIDDDFADATPVVEESPVAEPAIEEEAEQPTEEKKQPKVEDFFWDEEVPTEPVAEQQIEETPAVEEKKQPKVEDFFWDEEPDVTPAKEPVVEETVATVEEVPTEEAKEEPVAEAKTAKKRGRPRKVVKVEEAPVAPAKKRGRPRKVVAPAPAAEEKPVEDSAKKRGRPRKETTPVVEEPAKKRGRPRKTAEPEKKAEPAKKAKVKTKTEEPAKKTTRPKPRKRVVPKTKEEPKVEEKTEAPAKKRGRPRKEETPVVESPAKKRGRPRKEATVSEIDSLTRINNLIKEEEEKLNKMKKFLSNELDQVMVEEKSNADKERDKLIKAFEKLKTQANKAKENANSEDIALINKKLESLIKEINALNNKK